MSIRRSKKPIRKYGPVVAPLISLPVDRDAAAQMAVMEQAALEKHRPKLTPGVKVWYNKGSAGKGHAKFKQIEPGPRIVMTEPGLGIPVTCRPSEITDVG